MAVDAADISAFANKKSTRKVSHASGVELRGPLRVHSPSKLARAANVEYVSTIALAIINHLNAQKSLHLAGPWLDLTMVVRAAAEAMAVSKRTMKFRQ